MTRFLYGTLVVAAGAMVAGYWWLRGQQERAAEAWSEIGDELERLEVESRR